MLKTKDYKKYKYPLRLLLEGNSDAHSQLYSVVESLKDEHLGYKHPKVKNRTIGEMVSHAICTQYGFYTCSLVIGKECKCECGEPKTVKEALELIQKNLDEITKLWKKFTKEELQKEIKTEWGQVMSKELALFQSIEHIVYHVGEICFIAGIGGFYKGVLG